MQLVPLRPGKHFKKLLDKSSVKPFEEAMGLAMAAVGDSLERRGTGPILSRAHNRPLT
jgi:hypothetical protein